MPIYSSAMFYQGVPFYRILSIIPTWSYNIFTLLYFWYRWASKIRLTGTLIYLHNQWSAISNSFWLLIGYIAKDPLSEANDWQQVFTLVDFYFRVANTVSEKKVFWIILYRGILWFVMKFLGKKLLDLFLVKCVSLLTKPSARVSDMIHNLDISVGFIPIGLSTLAEENAESIVCTCYGPMVPSILD